MITEEIQSSKKSIKNDSESARKSQQTHQRKQKASEATWKSYKGKSESIKKYIYTKWTSSKHTEIKSKPRDTWTWTYPKKGSNKDKKEVNNG